MISALFFSFVGSLIICMALIPPLMATAGRLQFLDIPKDQRRVHSNPVAKVGGIAFGIGTFAAMLIWAPKDDIVVAGILGGVTILLFGMWDDRVGLSYTVKFLGQTLGAFVVMWRGNFHLNALPFLDGELSLWIAYPAHGSHHRRGHQCRQPCQQIKMDWQAASRSSVSPAWPAWPISEGIRPSRCL